VLEIEGATPPAQPAGPNTPTAPRTPTGPKTSVGLNTGSLSLETEDSHNPYRHGAEADRQRAPGERTRTDLRKLSAWIKLMRELEEAKKRNQDENEDKE
jgi:hypothetical protein